jgi:hypothetical protein
MNCVEFRRQLGAAPSSDEAAFVAHRESCARCAASWRRALGFEEQLAEAMALPLPHGLGDRIRLAQTTGRRGRQRTVRSRGTWIALAAAACLALVVGVAAWRMQRSPSLPDLVVDHVMRESSALVSHTPVPNVLVRRAFALRGVELADVPGDITWVNDCPLGPWSTVHMVVPVGDEPVTVIYVVGHHERVAGNFDRGMWQGRQVPVAGGTLVLLAENRSDFGDLERTWRDAIEGAPQVAAGSR